tara:strand:+ start:3013 stop:3231 length:219 start_codon:yes stop_codon:yes gene_type:complete
LPYGECGEVSARAIFSILERSVREELTAQRARGKYVKKIGSGSDFTLARARGNRPLAKRSAEKPEKDILKKW